MRTSSRKLCLGLFILISAVVVATTWAPSEIECPLCHTKNTFNVVMSYGTYIYNWPSKFQFIFWPRTDSSVVYTCKKCHLSLFMWDFTNFPKEKAADVQKVLAEVKLEREYARYTEIPMSQRLTIAEKVYSAIGKDPGFWCEFYRVQGYHLAAEKKSTEAAAARSKALLAAEKMITDPANSGRMKELLLIRGAMHHFLDDDAAAKQDFETALQKTYDDKKLTSEQNKNVNTNLDALIKEYLQRLAAKKVPKDDGSDATSN